MEIANGNDKDEFQAQPNQPLSQSLQFPINSDNQSVCFDEMQYFLLRTFKTKFSNFPPTERYQTDRTRIPSH